MFLYATDVLCGATGNTSNNGSTTSSAAMVNAYTQQFRRKWLSVVQLHRSRYAKYVQSLAMYLARIFCEIYYS
eukprot:m.66924 g.66924  ORF g.66924 m.66924 type:complete len:73 (-) comp15956_c0_seq2:1632-1850(-)